MLACRGARHFFRECHADHPGAREDHDRLQHGSRDSPRAHERVSQGARDAVMVRRFRWPFRRRHAGDRHHRGQDRAVRHGRSLRNAPNRGSARRRALSADRIRSDSVGHFEGDTLVIDTIGVRIGPFAMVDLYGTPQTAALHVVERYRLIESEAAREGQQWGLKENPYVPDGGDGGLAIDADYKGKGLQLQFTVEDDGVFTTPWSATVTYRRASGQWPGEFVCAENLRATYMTRDSDVPRADRPDF